MPSHTTYVAWLRAVNIGKRQVKMDALKKIFEGMKFKDVRTLIASGNVVFTADGKLSEDKLRALIEKTLEDKLGFDVTTMLRSVAELEALEKMDPFKGVAKDKDTRIYVTFLADEPSAAAWKALEALATTQQKFSHKGRELFTVYSVPIAKSEPFSNATVEKTLGVRATTRGWATVLKALALAKK